MATEIYMPQLGLTMIEGTVVRWLKAEGDPVKRGEPVLEIETDKVAVEIEAPAEGVLGPILAGEGSVVPIGGLLSHVLAPGEAPPTAPGAMAEAPLSSAPTGPTSEGQSPQVQAYIEASKHLEQADFEMLVAIESIDKAIVQDALGPMEADGPVQAAQANALEELMKALAALRPPDDQPQCDQKDEQNQQQQEEQEDQGSENARRALERADQEREQAERELYQRRPRTVIKDW